MTNTEVKTTLEAQGLSLSVGESAKFTLKNSPGSGYNWDTDMLSGQGVFKVEVAKPHGMLTGIMSMMGASENIEVTVTGQSPGNASLRSTLKRA